MLWKGPAIFLDELSGYDKAQTSFINTLVRTTRRRFEARAKQEQQVSPKIEKLTTTKYARVLDLKDYLYDKYFTLSFILNPANMVQLGTYDLFETPYNISNVSLNGSNSDKVPVMSLSALGHLNLIRRDSVNVIQFVRSMEEWPEDANGNPVQYSACMTGMIYK